MIAGSRALVYWLDIGALDAPEEQGNPVDRAVLTLLMIMGMFILRRRGKWKEIIKSNLPFILFLLYSGISICWSDYMLVAFKRYTKEIGNIIMVLVVLTSGEPIEAIKAVFRRCAFILIPLSIVLYKYYPSLGRTYSRWSGELMVIGVATHKNALGLLCVVCGMILFWDLLTPSNYTNRIVRSKFVIVFCLILTVWTLILSNSVTSIVCLAIGVLYLLFSRAPMVRAQTELFEKLALLLIVCLIAFQIAFDLSSIAYDVLGKDSTLTDRTTIWSKVIGMNERTLIGTGYDSFWLGERIEEMQREFSWRPTSAHSGYVETFINLGLIGLILLFFTMASTFSKIRKSVLRGSNFGMFRLGILLTCLIYNYTESAFSGPNIIWIAFTMIAFNIREGSIQEEIVVDGWSAS
jgi:O-antigen ligase